MKVPDKRKLKKVVEKGWEAGVEIWRGENGRGTGEEICEWVDIGEEWDVLAIMKK
ncbi:hypothetical protein Ptr902_06387 [Pyrenophora tritici-repentis]|nr:hypothetical protein Ptr902_06387 [Pyrenophora tritici-repentis]